LFELKKNMLKNKEKVYMNYVIGAADKIIF